MDYEEGASVSEEQVNHAGELNPTAPKKPYKAPQLVEYGHISKLTAGTSGSHSDKGTHSIHGGG
jgi:hypothetical protein